MSRGRRGPPPRRDVHVDLERGLPGGGRVRDRPEMTLRYASLDSPTLRNAYDAAMTKARRQLPIVVSGRPAAPPKVEWVQSEFLKTRIAHGYCSCHLAVEACPYANIGEQCDKFVPRTRTRRHHPPGWSPSATCSLTPTPAAGTARPSDTSGRHQPRTPPRHIQRSRPPTYTA